MLWRPVRARTPPRFRTPPDAVPVQFDFFPSWRLTLYLARIFVTRILAMLAVLVLVLLALDLLGSSGEILAVEGNGQAELLRYAAYRVPQLVARFLPYSVLLATVIALLTLNQNSEVVAMKAAGLSAHQILAPLLLTALVISGLSFAFNEAVVTRATASLKAWQATGFGEEPVGEEARGSIYLVDGNDILTARSVSGSGDALRLNEVTWIERAANGRQVRQYRGDRAVHADDGWRLVDATLFDVEAARAEPAGTVAIAAGITPRDIRLGNVDPDTVPFWRLEERIDAYAEAGRRTAELRAKYWHKLSGPLSAFLMPLLGAVAAFGLARSGQLFVRAIIAMALGFAYFVVDNAALAMGSFGGYPPFLAAWAPFLLFALIGETVLVRTEE